MADASTPEEAMIDDLAHYKGPGWVAYAPPRSPTSLGAAAVVLAGNRQIGWSRLLTLTGDDRFDRAIALAKRYNEFQRAL